MRQARAGHPQTSGKIEWLFREYKHNSCRVKFESAGLEIFVRRITLSPIITLPAIFIGRRYRSHSYFVTLNKLRVPAAGGMPFRILRITRLGDM